MSGIGPSELIVLVVIGLLILGPEKLPRVATQIGRWVGRARRTANQLRYQLEREITLADIEGKKKEREKQKKEEEKKSAETADQPNPQASDDANNSESSADDTGNDSPSNTSADEKDDQAK